MPLTNRAAQFSPFAALSGYHAAIRETERQTDSFIEIGESRENQLNERLLFIRENPDCQPEIEVTCFRPDERKSGGSYVTICGKVKKIDEYGRQIVFTNGKTLPIEHIFSIEGEFFGRMDRSDV